MWTISSKGPHSVPTSILKNYKMMLNANLRLLIFFRSLLECKIAFLSEIWQDAKINWQFKRNESQSTSAYSTLVPRIILTLAEGIPGSPIGDAVWEVIPTVPTLVHPSMCIGVDLRQLQVKWVRNDLECPQLIRQCSYSEAGWGQEPH